jgi:hypothetical protein
MSFEIGGWQDSEGDWHSGAPSGDPWDTEALRVNYGSDDDWTTILGPFPDFTDELEWEAFVDEWLDENDYGG